jgi:RWD domain.
MDYQEEQSNEIEALDSIYYGDMEILEKDPHVFTIPIQSECVDDEHQMNCLLRFQYTPKYPEEIPIIEIENCDNIDEDVERELKEYLLTQANENLGKIPTILGQRYQVPYLLGKFDFFKVTFSYPK